MTVPVDAGAEVSLPRSLLAYCRTAFDAPQLSYATPPARFPTGVANRVYAIEFAGAPQALAGPLVLKLYGSHAAPAQATVEALIQDGVAAQGFPAPRVVHVCEDAGPLGAPFLLMKCLPGTVLLEPFAKRRPPLPTVIRLVPQLRFRMPTVIATILARLHSLDPAPLHESLAAAGLVGDVAGLDARLRRIRERGAGEALRGFDAAFRWLSTHRPQERLRPAICHGDLWFGNVLERDGEVTGVLDWDATLVVIGDPMYDLGIASVLLKCGMADVPGPMRAIARRGQHAMASRLVNSYARSCPVDPRSLAYFELLRCLEFLSWVAVRRVDASLRVRGPDEDLLEIAGASEGFVRFFREGAGIDLELPAFA